MGQTGETTLTVSEIAGTPYEKLGRHEVVPMTGFSERELVDVIVEASDQQPPNTEVMVAAGAICLVRKITGDFEDQDLLMSGIRAAFPNYH